MKRFLIILIIVIVLAMSAYLIYRSIGKTKSIKALGGKTANSLLFYDDIKHIDRESFKSKVITISEKLEIDPNWLMAVMWKESRIDSTIVNPISNATGLIQFMPKTVEALGTTQYELKTMTPLQQLDYVYHYYKGNGMTGRMKSYYDLYLATFFPAAIGKPDTYVFQTDKLPSHVIAEQNPTMDINKDNKITIAEFKQYCLKGLPNDVKTYVK